jgi:hypothetical protein
MITTIIILALAFTWLLYETDNLRVRLLVGSYCNTGECSQWHMPDDAVDDDMRHELIRT